MKRPKQYHRVLGVPHDASPAEIKRAYRELAKRLHPDRARNPEHARAAEERLKEINAAWNEYRLVARQVRHTTGAPKRPPRDRHRTAERVRETRNNEERERMAREKAEEVRRNRDREIYERYAQQHAHLKRLVVLALGAVAVLVVLCVVLLVVLVF